MYYNVCPFCGANLDPGERCDCEKKEAATAATVTTSDAEKRQSLTAAYSIPHRFLAVKRGGGANG